MIAHVGGLPLEETIVQLASAGIGALIALRALSDRIRRRARLGRRARPG